MEIVRESTMRNRLKCYKNRWVLFLSLAILFALSLWVPKHIFFYEVYGNSSIPENQIISFVSTHGLSCGDRTSSVNGEKIKNQIMEEIPDIEWLGVRMRGCVAEIHIREKEIPKTNNSEFLISSIIALEDGVIDSITVVQGIPLCKIGQAVQKGQVLISGYEDCGLLLRGTNASGEIYAKTNRTNQMYSPYPTVIRNEEKERKYQYSLQLGKIIINFNNFSGISPTSCVKIETKKCLTLPGGFRLPISVNIQEIILYETVSADGYSSDEIWLCETLDKYVLQNMSVGEILQKKYSVQKLPGFAVVAGTYACREEIGIIRIEEILKSNGKNN